MKKKLKEITIEDVIKICEKYMSCGNCEFQEYCVRQNSLHCLRDNLEKEIEINE